MKWHKNGSQRRAFASVGELSSVRLVLMLIKETDFYFDYQSRLVHYVNTG